MVVCEDQLVVLPFRQDELEGVDVDIGASLDGAAPSSDGGVVDPWAEAAATVDRQSRRVCGPAFVCSLPSLTSPAHLEGVEGTVIAVTFLQGYYQPTMCFLTVSGLLSVCPSTPVCLMSPLPAGAFPQCDFSVGTKEFHVFYHSRFLGRACEQGHNHLGTVSPFTRLCQCTRVSHCCPVFRSSMAYPRMPVK